MVNDDDGGGKSSRLNVGRRRNEKQIFSSKGKLMPRVSPISHFPVFHVWFSSFAIAEAAEALSRRITGWTNFSWCRAFFFTICMSGLLKLQNDLLIDKLQEVQTILCVLLSH